MPSNVNAVRSTEKRLIVDNIFTLRIVRTYRDLFQALLLHCFFFFCQSLYSATLIHSQSRMIKITFCSLSFRSTLISLILVYFWFILPHSVVIPPRSSMFRYHSCLFRLIPVSFGFIPESFCLVMAYCGLFLFICVSFHLILVSLQLVSVYSGTILVHSASFRCHSSLFRYIPFLSCV